jgi:Ca2+-binding RTX toxin-like protein
VVRDGFTLDASAESDGNLTVYGGLGNDTITTGAGNDWIYGGLGADVLKGGLGADTYVYTKAVQSVGSSHDIIIGFDPTVDKIDLPTGISVTGIDAAINSGAASAATLDDDLTNALVSLGAHHAVQFTATSGDLAGHVFEVIDSNGVAGYQAGKDMVIELQNPVTAITTPAPFI